MRRMNRVNCTWTNGLAYVIGIITTDGNLSPDGRHLNITSKDFDLVYTVRKVLGLKNKIGKKARGGSVNKNYFVLQFGDIAFYEFLLSLGLTPAKSKTLKMVSIPKEFFADFLRGCIDGDGSIDSFTHPESVLPQIRLRLVSASPEFLSTILNEVRSVFNIVGGHIYDSPKKSVSVLSFGKHDALKILRLMYYSTHLPALNRKRRVAEQFMRTGQVVE